MRLPPPAAVRACRDLTRRHASTFYLGSLLLGPRERAAVWAVYAACRLGDDLVDEGDAPPEARRAALRAWRTQVRASAAGLPSPDPVWDALAWAFTAYDLPPGAFEDLARGFEDDLDGREIRDDADLARYCWRVAGVVGLLVAPIVGYGGGAATLAAALRLGQAMQLTNILRDVGADARRGRVYLPSAALSRHGLASADLARREVTPAHRALTAEYVALARRWYAEAEPGLARLHPRARPAIVLAARAYAGILADLERGGYDNLARRAHVPRARQLALVPGAFWPRAAGRSPS